MFPNPDSQSAAGMRKNIRNKLKFLEDKLQIIEDFRKMSRMAGYLLVLAVWG